MLEKFVNGQDVLLFQPTGSGKFECFDSGVSDNIVNKERDKSKYWASRDKTVGQIEVI